MLRSGSRRPPGTIAGSILLHAALFTVKEAIAGFLLGAVIGFVLGVILAQFDVLAARADAVRRRGRRRVPILAIAPMVVRRARQRLDRRVPPTDWVRVAVIAAYLTFFPVTVNTLRGLESADRGRSS